MEALLREACKDFYERIRVKYLPRKFCHVCKGGRSETFLATNGLAFYCSVFIPVWWYRYCTGLPVHSTKSVFDTISLYRPRNPPLRARFWGPLTQIKGGGFLGLRRLIGVSLPNSISRSGRAAKSRGGGFSRSRTRRGGGGFLGLYRLIDSITMVK